MPAALQAVGPRGPASPGGGGAASSNNSPCSSATCAASRAAVASAASWAATSSLPFTVDLVSSASLCVSLPGKPPFPGPVEGSTEENNGGVTAKTLQGRPRPGVGQRGRRNSTRVS